MSPVQVGRVHVGALPAGGVRFCGRHAGNGLDNGMFETAGCAKVLVDLCLRMARV